MYTLFVVLPVTYGMQVSTVISLQWQLCLQQSSSGKPIVMYVIINNLTECLLRAGSFLASQYNMQTLPCWSLLYRINGENAFPVLNTMASGKLQQLSSQIADKVPRATLNLYSMVYDRGNTNVHLLRYTF